MYAVTCCHAAIISYRAALRTRDGHCAGWALQRHRTVRPSFAFSLLYIILPQHYRERWRNLFVRRLTSFIDHRVRYPVLAVDIFWRQDGGVLAYGGVPRVFWALSVVDTGSGVSFNHISLITPYAYTWLCDALKDDGRWRARRGAADIKWVCARAALPAGVPCDTTQQTSLRTAPSRAARLLAFRVH